MFGKIEIPGKIRDVIDILGENGYKGYIVGGCVRDMLMDKIPHDFDITTDAFPEETVSCFADHRVILTGLKHGTVTVVHEGENIEITTFRTDGRYLDNRHPENVTFVRNIEEDLSRRDFTVNAMAYNPSVGLVDLFEGQKDIEKKTIRCVGNADTRFNEDGLRILRAMRFASVLGFEVERSTAESVISNRELLKNISAERIYSELTKLILGNKAIDTLLEFYPVLETVLGKVPREGIELLDLLPPDHTLRYAALLYDRTPEKSASTMRSLKTDNETCRAVKLIVSSVGLELPKSSSDRFNTECAYLLSRYGKSDLERIITFKRALAHPNEMEMAELDRLLENTKEMSDSGACVSIKQLSVDGGMLASVGVPKTSEMGRVLQALLCAVIEGEIPNEREPLLEMAKKLIK